MIKQGIRLYSLPEIHAMIQEGTYTDGFREYLDSAPEGIQSYVSYLAGKAEKECAERCSDNADIQPQEKVERKEKDGSTGVESAGCEDKWIQKEQTIQDNAESDTNREKFSEDKNPYAQMKFGKRITVQKLILHEQTQNGCQIHLMPYTEIQVVIKLNLASYSLITNCCQKCKFLYMEKGTFDGIASVLKRKHINYVWIPARGEEDSEEIN